MLKLCIWRAYNLALSVNERSTHTLAGLVNSDAMESWKCFLMYAFLLRLVSCLFVLALIKNTKWRHSEREGESKRARKKLFNWNKAKATWNENPARFEMALINCRMAMCVSTEYLYVAPYFTGITCVCRVYKGEWNSTVDTSRQEIKRQYHSAHTWIFTWVRRREEAR